MKYLKRVFAVLLAVLCIPFVGNTTTENKKVHAVNIPSEEPVFTIFAIQCRWCWKRNFRNRPIEDLLFTM